MNSKKINWLVSNLNKDISLWKAFLDNPHTILLEYDLHPEDEEFILFVQVCNLVKKIPEYKPGWPISRLPKDKQFDTFSILLNQKKNLEKIGNQ